MIIKARGSVTMPKLPRSIGNLIGYAKEVNQAIQQLRDRAWEIPPTPKPAQEVALPFQVSASASLLKAASGVIGATSISGAVLEEESPADGDWYLVTKITINGTTGEVTDEEVYWNSTIPTDTSTTFHGSLALIVKTAGEITSSDQYNYGPVFVLVGGGITDVWEVKTF